mmetsp:Transcript_9161/g.11459  ORF Transcript_9161/g.11459 Transcript_9161/m.11459 type:complete len:216 (+) Transcript_9161:222-869(+)
MDPPGLLPISCHQCVTQSEVKGSLVLRFHRLNEVHESGCVFRRIEGLHAPGIPLNFLHTNKSGWAQILLLDEFHHGLHVLSTFHHDGVEVARRGEGHIIFFGQSSKVTQASMDAIQASSLGFSPNRGKRVPRSTLLLETNFWFLSLHIRPCSVLGQLPLLSHLHPFHTQSAVNFIRRQTVTMLRRHARCALSIGNERFTFAVEGWCEPPPGMAVI